MNADKIYQLLHLHCISVYDVFILWNHLKARYDNTRHEAEPPWWLAHLGAFPARGDGTPLLPLLTLLHLTASSLDKKYNKKHTIAFLQQIGRHQCYLDNNTKASFWSRMEVQKLILFQSCWVGPRVLTWSALVQCFDVYQNWHKSSSFGFCIIFLCMMYFYFRFEGNACSRTIMG